MAPEAAALAKPPRGVDATGAGRGGSKTPETDNWERNQAQKCQRQAAPARVAHHEGRMTRSLL